MLQKGVNLMYVHQKIVRKNKVVLTVPLKLIRLGLGPKSFDHCMTHYGA
jgi:hypothetical protein